MTRQFKIWFLLGATTGLLGSIAWLSHWNTLAPILTLVFVCAFWAVLNSDVIYEALDTDLCSHCGLAYGCHPHESSNVVIHCNGNLIKIRRGK